MPSSEQDYLEGQCVQWRIAFWHPDPIRTLRMWLLSMRKLSAFSPDFEAFFNEEASIEIVCSSGCIYDHGQKSVCFQESGKDGYILLRNTNTYLLIETVLPEKRWSTAFSFDEKGVLENFEQQLLPWHPERSDSWPFLFPLIRKAHKEAHPKPNPLEPNLRYLSDLATSSLHAVHPKDFIESLIEEIETGDGL